MVRKAWLLWAIFALVALFGAGAEAQTVYAAKSATESDAATTYTCLWNGNTCAAGLYYIQWCNDDAGTDSIFVAVGATAVNDNSGTRSIEIKKGECFGPMAFNSVTFSAIEASGAAGGVQFRYTFTRVVVEN